MDSRFADEGEATLKPFAIAEEQQWTWYETYLLAKETAVDRLSSKENEAKLPRRAKSNHACPIAVRKKPF